MNGINLFLNSIKTASLANRQYAYVDYSKINVKILDIFLEEGFILNYTLISNGYKVELNHTFPYNKLVSEYTPGNPKYRGKNSIRKNFSWAIITSAKGIEKWPSQKKICSGGQVLCGFKLT
jgi:ribosomal protein S8